MPIRAAGATRWKAFNYGQASAIVEPIFATIGAAAILVSGKSYIALCTGVCCRCNDFRCC